MIGYLLLVLGPCVSALAILVQGLAPEHMRGTGWQLVQLIALNAVAAALVIAGAVVLLVGGRA